MRSKTKDLIKNIFLFAISNFIPKLLSFVMIPIYTSYLTSSEYGYADLITTTVALILPVFSLNIHDAITRFTLDKKNSDSDIFSISFRIYLIGIIIVFFVCFILNTLNLFNLPNYFFKYLFVYYVSSTLLKFFTYFCKGINRVSTIVISSVVNSFVTVIANIILLVIMKQHVNGYLISNTIGSFAAIFILFVHGKLYKYIKKIKDKKLFKDIIAFSIPLIFSAIGWWVNNSIDKYFLVVLEGVAVTGIYSVAYKIPNILAVFQSTFTSAWSISSIKEFDSKDQDGFFWSIFNNLNFIMIIGASLLMIFNIFISKLLYSGDFFEAWRFVPPLILTIVFNSSSMYLESILISVKNTKSIGITAIIGALINITLDFILIKSYSAYGAAIATLISYVIVMIIKYHYVTKYLEFKYSNKIIFLSYFLLALQMVISYFGNKYILFQILLLVMLIFINKNKINNFMLMIRKIMRKNNEEN